MYYGFCVVLRAACLLCVSRTHLLGTLGLLEARYHNIVASGVVCCVCEFFFLALQQ